MADFVAGLAAGACSTLVSHPLDVIKVRMQVNRGGNMTISKAIISGQLYRGLGINMVANTLSWGAYFGLYRYLVKMHTGETPLGYFVASISAGLTTGIATTPLWVLKTRILGTMSTDPSAYRSIREGVTHISRGEGVAGFWRGYLPGMVGLVQAGIQFTLYDSLKQMYRQMNQDSNTNHVNTQPSGSNLEYIVCSVISKLVATSSVYPYQVVRARMQFETTGEPLLQAGGGLRLSEPLKRRGEVSSLIKAVKAVHKEHAFYKGLTATLARVLPSTCVTFLVYENCKQLLTVS